MVKVSIMRPLIIALITLIIIFAILYKEIEQTSFLDGLYRSVMIQSTIGPTESPKNDTSKFLTAIQSFTVLLMGGVIIFSK